jgi:integrase
MVDFLMVHYGRRISDHAMRAELRRAAVEVGLDGATPHQLRHTYATALEVSDVAADASFDMVCDRCPVRGLGLWRMAAMS